MKNYQSEIKSLKNIISNVNYGIKTNSGIRPSANKRSLEKNFKKPLTNKLLRSHWKNEQTIYFYGNEDINKKECLVMIDIDVDKNKKEGSKEGAIKFAEHLKITIQDFYYEESTNGKGIHGYFIVDKCEKNSEEVNKVLKKFENFLMDQKEKTKADIELVEIKGTLHEIKYKFRRIKKIKFGTLAKIPRNIKDFINYKNKNIKITDIEEKYSIENKIKKEKKGSISKKIINEEDLLTIKPLEDLSREIFGDKPIKNNKFKITHEDIAIGLMLLCYFKKNKNKDKTLPTNRVMMLWKKLYECNDINRAWNHHRWKTIRDLLSKKGLIYWIDNNYTYGDKRTNQKGIACKWEISKKMYMYIKMYLKEFRKEKRASLMDTKSRENIKKTSIKEILDVFSYKIPILNILMLNNKDYLMLNKANKYIKNSFCYV